MPSYDTLRKRILAVFPSVAEPAMRHDAREAQERLAVAEQRLRDGTFQVVVCGEFKRGKSSLLNALLDLYPGLLPVGEQVVTSVVTRVSYGAERRVTVTRENDLGTLEPEVIPPDDLARYVSEDSNQGNRLRVRAVDVQLPNTSLEAGLVLVDTPGIRGIYDDHGLATRAALEGADAIVFVADATEPLADDELDFLRGAAERAQISDDEAGLLVVVTKTDQNSEHAEAVARIRERVAGALGRRADQIPIVAVSSKAKERYLQRHSARQLKLSNFEELDGMLWAVLTRRQARVLLLAALAELRQSAQSLATPYREMIAALESSSAAFSGHEADIQARYNHFDRQFAPDAPWHAGLAAGMKAVVGQTKAKAASAMHESLERLKGKLGDVLNDADRAGHTVQDEVFGIVSRADSLLAHEAGALQRRLEERTGVTVKGEGTGRFAAPPVPDIRIRARRRPRDPREYGREKLAAGLSDTGGLAGGRLLGLLLFPTVPADADIAGVVGGGLLFAITTAVITLREYRDRAAQKADDELRRRDLEADITRYYRQIHTSLDAEIERRAAEFTGWIDAELQSLIRQQLASSGESLRRLRGLVPGNAASTAELRKQFAAELAILDGVLDRVAGLEQEVLDLAGGTST